MLRSRRHQALNECLTRLGSVVADVYIYIYMCICMSMYIEVMYIHASIHIHTHIYIYCHLCCRSTGQSMRGLGKAGVLSWMIGGLSKSA